jgi:queuine tRNA-ribosyltransferase subunit QTRTD1
MHAEPELEPENEPHLLLSSRSLAYRLDSGPLVGGCSCFTCSNHSRAYLHHLLHVHEMLAEVLLEMHNTHHWQLFFAAVRAAIQEGRLQQYSAWFESRRAQAP